MSSKAHLTSNIMTLFFTFLDKDKNRIYVKININCYLCNMLAMMIDYYVLSNMLTMMIDYRVLCNMLIL